MRLIYRYENLKVGPTGEFNYGFWGQECGPEKDPSPKRIHKYMEDAVSVNTYLKPTHFEDHHVYRVEWQPGATGHLEWYERYIYVCVVYCTLV